LAILEVGIIDELFLDKKLNEIMLKNIYRYLVHLHLLQTKVDPYMYAA